MKVDFFIKDYSPPFTGLELGGINISTQNHKYNSDNKNLFMVGISINTILDDLYCFVKQKITYCKLEFVDSSLSISLNRQKNMILLAINNSIFDSVEEKCLIQAFYNGIVDFYNKFSITSNCKTSQAIMEDYQKSIKKFSLLADG